MKLLNAQQIHQWDEFTMAHEPISSVDLMERAARRCTDWLLKNIEPSSSVRIFCGKGNNGGDGLAIARQLIEAGLSPVIYILEFGAKGTEDFQINLNRLHELTKEIYFIHGYDYCISCDNIINNKGQSYPNAFNVSIGIDNYHSFIDNCCK